MIHSVKSDPKYFKATAQGIKGFEVRRNDRPYQVGDYIAQNEWNHEGYTGKCTLQKIIYILDDTEYCKEGYVVLGLEPCAIRTRGENMNSMTYGYETKTPVYERNHK